MSYLHIKSLTIASTHNKPRAVKCISKYFTAHQLKKFSLRETHISPLALLSCKKKSYLIDPQTWKRTLNL